MPKVEWLAAEAAAIEGEEDEKERVRLLAILEPYALENIRWGVPRHPPEMYHKMVDALRQPLSEYETKLAADETRARRSVAVKALVRDSLIRTTMRAGRRAVNWRKDQRRLEVKRKELEKELEKLIEKEGRELIVV